MRDLWDYTQKDPYYKGQTTFILTTDHGRGTQPLDTWKDHGTNIEGADQVWMITYGAHIGGKGEIREEEQLYSTKVVKKIESLIKR